MGLSYSGSFAILVEIGDPDFCGFLIISLYRIFYHYAIGRRLTLGSTSEQVMDRFWLHFTEGWRVAQGSINPSLAVIQFLQMSEN